MQVGINYNGENINLLTYNSNSILGAYYNETKVFDQDKMVNYTFPNAGAYMSGNPTYGIETFWGASNTSVTCYNSFAPWKAFDNITTGTANMFSPNKSSKPSATISLGISFPFKIYPVYFHIYDATRTQAGSSGWYAMMTEATFYFSESVQTAKFTSTSPSALSVSRPRTDVAEGATAWNKIYSSDGNGHDSVHYYNSDQTPMSEAIQSICCNGTTTGDYLSIAELYINFNVKLSDLRKWANEYGITIDGYYSDAI